MDEKKHLTPKQIEQLVSSPEKRVDGEMKGIREHLGSCPDCIKKINAMKRFQGVLDHFEPGLFDKVWSVAGDSRKIELSGQWIRRLNPAGVDPRVELAKKFGKPGRLASMLEDRDGAQGPVLLAAKQKDKGVTAVCKGVAFDRKSGRSYLVNVSAWVDQEVKPTGGELHLAGNQVDEERHGDVVVAAKPLNNLRDLLYQLFKAVPLLESHELHKHDILVTICSPERLIESQSLLLATFMAILKSANSIDSDDDFVYSGQVGTNGAVNPVGGADEKANVLDTCDCRMIMSKENEEDLDEKTLAKFGDRIRFAKNIDDVIGFVWPQGVVFREAVVSDLSKDQEETGGRKTEGFSVLSAAKSVFVGGFAALTVLLFLLGLSAGSPAFLSDLMAAWLLSGFENMKAAAMAICATGYAAVAIWVACKIAVELKGAGRRPGGAKAAGWNANLATTVIVLLPVLFLAVSSHLFLSVLSPGQDDSERYERVAYLFDKPVVGTLAGGISNRTLEKIRAAGNEKNSDAARMVSEVVSVLSPANPDFDAVFVQAAGLLIAPGCKNDEAAVLLIEKYFDFSDAVEGKDGAKKMMERSLGYANILMLKYRMRDLKTDGETFDQRLTEIIEKFGVTETIMP